MTSSRAIRVLVGICFLALLATPLVIKRISSRQEAARSTSDPGTDLARYGFHLADVPHAAGIDFVHQAPVLDANLATIMPEVASMGASVSIVDFDRDGWPDIY